jgi:hypothetical protein
MAGPSYINIGGVNNTTGTGGSILLQAGDGMYNSGTINFSLPLAGSSNNRSINFYLQSGAIKIGNSSGSLPMTIYGNGNLTTSGTITSYVTITGYSFVSTVTSAAPFGVSSTTKVNNLNVDMLDGFHAPKSGFVGLSENQTLTNKSLTSPTISGGSINGTTIGAATPSTGVFTSLTTTTGNVGIGTTNTQGYKLAVNGGIIAEEVKVVTDVPEADYVFKNNYNLMPLNQVEQYVNEHQHLPEVPSTEQFKKDGYKVGEMDELLLKKVEELTLYVIDLKKENERLAKEVENLKSK